MSWTAWNPFDQGVQVDDGGVSFVRRNDNGLSLLEMADDYFNQSSDQTPRTVQVRTLGDGVTSTSGQWESHAVPYVPPPPLVNLDWMQSNPQGPGPWVHLVDDDQTSYFAQNPEGWDLQRCVDDFCEAPVPGYIPPTPISFNRAARTVQARLTGEQLQPFEVEPSDPWSGSP